MFSEKRAKNGCMTRGLGVFSSRQCGSQDGLVFELLDVSLSLTRGHVWHNQDRAGGSLKYLLSHVLG
jgi:hypothetical protein